MKTPEKVVQDAILAYLKRLQKEGKPIFFERRQAGGLSYKMGIPDIYAVVNGVHLEIEVKKVGGELSVMQEKFAERCDRCGILWICADNIEIVKECIERLI